MGIWSQLNGVKYFVNIKLDPWRIVEDQSKSTTRKFVDSLKEHEILENLIDNNKPKAKYFGDEKYFQNIHYLLFTPFRYPPLRWGSRFGTRFERGILYASLDIHTAMSEKAYYRLAFFRATEGNLGGKTTSFTAFKVHIESEIFINLCEEPFLSFENEISSRSEYVFAQALGKEMRECRVECFKYKAARSASGYNVGVFSPKALQKNAGLEHTFEPLQCYSTKEVVEFSFKHKITEPRHLFPLDRFLIEGKMPSPPI